MQSDDLGLVERIMAACVGHPHAKIAWPHRILHEAAEALAAKDAEIERLVAERDEAERVQKRMAKDWLDFCEAIGVRFDTHEAVAYSLGAEWSKLEAQRDKLKEALTEIAASQHGSDGWVAQRARQALGDT